MISFRASLVTIGLASFLCACRSSPRSSSGSSETGAGVTAVGEMPGAGPADAAPHGGGPRATVKPSAETAALLLKIHGYAEWPRFPENPQPAFSKQHNRMWVVAHYNDVVARAIQSKTRPLPNGAIIVKDNFERADATEPAVITTMSKQGGRWYWVESTPQGDVVVMDAKPLEGFDLVACAGCHAEARENDQVFTHEFK